MYVHGHIFIHTETERTNIVNSYTFGSRYMDVDVYRYVLSKQPCLYILSVCMHVLTCMFVSIRVRACGKFRGRHAHRMKVHVQSRTPTFRLCTYVACAEKH